jgi:hypothetical protein
MSGFRKKIKAEPDHWNLKKLCPIEDPAMLR